ncbi:hypothetical protein J4208_02015 [Candidatus Woesearchaeota archaeon]|nr:hypothetical protein [Candidatus Woesearchaeota archaeon]
MIDPLSKKFLLQQGSCCGSRCTNCPYEPKHRHGATNKKISK